MDIYNTPEWQELQAKCDEAHKQEAKALRAYEKADSKYAVDDPKYIKARTVWFAARDNTSACYKALRDLLDKYNK